MATVRWKVTMLAPVALALGLACNPEQKQQPKSRNASGIVTKIDIAGNRVTMKMRDPKNTANFLEKEVEGTLTPTTEITIRDKRATLADIRLDDRVEAIGYEEGAGDDKRIIAQQIKIDRPEEIKIAPKVDVVKPPTPAVTTSAPAMTIENPTITPAQPVAATQAAPSDNPANRQKNEQILALIIEEFRKNKRELVARREELLKAGKSASDTEILDIENKIRKADAYIAQVEEQGLQRGIMPATQPAAPSTSP